MIKMAAAIHQQRHKAAKRRMRIESVGKYTAVKSSTIALKQFPGSHESRRNEMGLNLMERESTEW